MSFHNTVSSAAQAPRLLVVSDFDGTLAGISEDPMNVPVNRTSVAALSALAGMPDTRVVILSGRNLAQLDVVCPTQPPIARVGSHGAEPERHEAELSPEQRAALDALAAELEALCEGVEGAFVEYKPYQRVFHYIRVRDEEVMRGLLDEVSQLDPRGTHVTWGKRVVEFSVSTATKGTWLRGEMERWQPQATVFLGDDTTDEHGFEVMGSGDLSVKVGQGDTAANTRVADIQEVGELLDALARARAERIDVATLNPAQHFHLAAAELAAVLVQATPEQWDAHTRDLLAPLISAEAAHPSQAWARFTAATASAVEAAGEDSAFARLLAQDLCPEIFQRSRELAMALGARTYLG
ncbi:trehalose-phosphatase [Corynebacterium lowii]|uniref:Trehalose 6-phosphate phosphatase n=1 Tax=Corynebacterium lowii TaxID=1544413 RepID=A0A0Q1AHX1_9CORY|nr:trehalose-phosphatase [Corynebacterium lowii]KQB86228.1 Trehalose-6-phosphate phosphatase [Corynebacterium lowii]MDP9852702.1 trehalose 6-phosphate phosphatase [Corynebacterium lowii]